MAITVNDAHRLNHVQLINAVIMQFQDQVFLNAARQRTWAVNESKPLAEVQTIISDTLTGYTLIQSTFTDFKDTVVVNDGQYAVVASAQGILTSDLNAIVLAVSGHITVFDGMPKTTYAEIVLACDFLLANVDRPPGIG